jgi:hypothetical protein
MYNKFILGMILLLLFASGCSNNDINDKSLHTPMNTSYSSNSVIGAEITAEINEYILKNEAIYDVVSIKSNKEIYVAVKVKQMKRLSMKKIEKVLEEKLSDRYAQYRITVSTDKKLFLEVEKLLNEKDKSNLDERFKKLIKLSEDKA